MGSKHLTDEQIALFAEAMSANSSEKLSLEWRSHVSNCDECAQMVLMVSDTISDLELSDNVVPFDKKNDRNNERWIAIAASIVIVLSAGFYLTTFLNNQSLDENLVQTDSIPVKIEESIIVHAEINESPRIVKQEVKEVVLEEKQIEIEIVNEESSLLAYVPNEQLEKLSDRFSSSSAMRGDDIAILSDNTIEGSVDELNIQWENEGQQLLIVEFFNNKGDKLFEEETTASDYNLNKLSEPGLYYWKLINEDFDLLFCGRIKIK